MRLITPFLWFDGNAEEAVKFYCSVFPDSEITPTEFLDMIDGKDMEHNSRVMAAMNTMIKYDLEALRAANRGNDHPLRRPTGIATSFSSLSTRLEQ